MKLWKITRTTPVHGHDIYFAAIVAAKTEEDARLTHPNPKYKWDRSRLQWRYASESLSDNESWPGPESVVATLVGTAAKGTVAGTVLCADFNAG